MQATRVTPKRTAALLIALLMLMAAPIATADDEEADDGSTTWSERTRDVYVDVVGYLIFNEEDNYLKLAPPILE